VSDEAILIPES